MNEQDNISEQGTIEASNVLSIDEYQIDPELVRRWFEIPPTSPIAFEGKRVSFDMLYSAIDGVIATQIRMMSAMVDSPMEKTEAFAKQITEIGNGIIGSLNHLRHFQTIVMQEATGSTLNDKGRVETGDDSNGQ